jgi:hypothetical protein
LDYFQPKVENDIMEKSINSAGHVAALPMGRILLNRFQIIKHSFNGTGTGDIDLPRDIKIMPEHEEELGEGTLTLTEYAQAVHSLHTLVLTINRQDLQAMFENCVEGALDLIQRQVVQVQNTMDGDVPLHVTVGTFQNSEYFLVRKTNCLRISSCLVAFLRMSIFSRRYKNSVTKAVSKLNGQMTGKSW